MKTDDLIKLLVADGPRPTVDTSRNVLWASALGALTAAVLLTFAIGARGDFKVAMYEWRFVAKFVVAAALVVAMSRAVLMLSRPDVTARRALMLVALPVGLLALALVGEMAAQPLATWSEWAMGTNFLVCLVTIPMLAVGPLVALLWVLRSSAPQSPQLLGGVAGALAGGIGAFFYAAHCTDDSPMFVAIWYTLAILILASIGALIGRRVLAW
ncbi:MAG: NrsF family protein [Hyphomicrobiaceae bacterium]|nr:DUF1109 family protein [Hyphomicrobiaceae bacterium]